MSPPIKLAPDNAALANALEDMLSPWIAHAPIDGLPNSPIALGLLAIHALAAREGIEMFPAMEEARRQFTARQWPAEKDVKS
jgi:hypothetical protein